MVNANRLNTIRPTVLYHWVPRGDVLRCIIDDGGPEGEVTIHTDDKDLSLGEFGRMLTVHAGWA